MNRTLTLLVSLALLLCPLALLAQVPNEGLANQIIAARQKNGATLRQFSWDCRTEYILNGSVKDTRVEQVVFGPDGNVQRTTISNQEARMPRGFLRRAAAEDEKKDMEKYIHGLHRIIDSYVLPTSGAIINFLGQANLVNGTDVDGKPTVTATGTSVIVPGDSLTITFDTTTHLPTRMEVSTTHAGDPVTISSTFVTMASGLNHLQYCTAAIPDKGVMLQVQNYDYFNNN